MSTPYLAKAMYRDRTNIGAFIDQFGFGQGKVFFMTVTFKNNVDKSDCATSFNVFRSYLCKCSIRASHGIPVDASFDYISVWEEHKKGGWHLHILGHIEGVATSRLRDLVRSFLRSTSSSVGFINIKWTYGHDTNGIKYYVSKYLMKDSRKSGVRYVNYSRGWCRTCCMPFAWVRGASAMWRKACREMFNNFSYACRVFYNGCQSSTRFALVDLWQKGDYLGVLLLFKRFRFGGLSILSDAARERFRDVLSGLGVPVGDTVSDGALADFLAWPSKPVYKVSADVLNWALGRGMYHETALA